MSLAVVPLLLGADEADVEASTGDLIVLGITVALIVGLALVGLMKRGGGDTSPPVE